MNLNRSFWLIFTILGLAMACSPDKEQDSAAAEDGITVYLVRHAEKAAGGDDPALSEAGIERARLLADRLDEAGIETIWSSDYQRTRQTAAPLARNLAIDIETYDPSDLESLAGTLEERGETALVVGHSNTTPELSAQLGGDAGSPINEAGEYDRLYILNGVGSGDIDTMIERFGAPYEPAGTD
ncbi:histidine phosphatase family protein [Henriciella sp.]|uniref:SixA phosphatase family protein n=1 Tax=Henriciella sp. TaxID=1968823 RepID=UPI0026073A8B|nr:phosphoglycerate mutase family protein [Henriciella sp.]